MEDNVFVKPEIRRQLDEYVVVKLSIDGRDGPNLINVRLANERFNCHVIPFYVTLRSDGEETGRYTGSTRSGGYAKFREFVKMGLRP